MADKMTPNELRQWAEHWTGGTTPRDTVYALESARIAHAVLSLLERHEQALGLLARLRPDIDVEGSRAVIGVEMSLAWLAEVDALLAGSPAERTPAEGEWHECPTDSWWRHLPRNATVQAIVRMESSDNIDQIKILRWRERTPATGGEARDDPNALAAARSCERAVAELEQLRADVDANTEAAPTKTWGGSSGYYNEDQVAGHHPATPTEAAPTSEPAVDPARDLCQCHELRVIRSEDSACTCLQCGKPKKPAAPSAGGRTLEERVRNLEVRADIQRDKTKVLQDWRQHMLDQEENALAAMGSDEEVVQWATHEERIAALEEKSHIHMRPEDDIMRGVLLRLDALEQQMRSLRGEA